MPAEGNKINSTKKVDKLPYSYNYKVYYRKFRY